MTTEQAEIEAFKALIEYARGLEKLGYTGADVLVSYYERKLEELEKK
jgi:hypothetical protein